MPPPAVTPAADARGLKVSNYERASSMLLSLLICLGLAVFVLFILWLSSKIFVPQIAVPVQMMEIGEGEGGGDGRAMGGSQLETPSDEPFVGSSAPTTNVQEDLNLLADTVAAKTAELDDPALVTPVRQGSFGSGGGIGGGFGDGRGLGHGPGRGGVPRHWEVYFGKGATADSYAKQLDFFGIELAVLQPDGKVVYAYNLAKPKPDTRIGPSDKEKRYYLTWRNGELQQADREILERAGIDVGDRLIIKFLPQATEIQLMTLEKAFRGAEPKNITKTRFGVQATSQGFAFFVIDQSVKQ